MIVYPKPLCYHFVKERITIPIAIPALVRYIMIFDLWSAYKEISNYWDLFDVSQNILALLQSYFKAISLSTILAYFCICSRHILLLECTVQWKKGMQNISWHFTSSFELQRMNSELDHCVINDDNCSPSVPLLLLLLLLLQVKLVSK